MRFLRALFLIVLPLTLSGCFAWLRPQTMDGDVQQTEAQLQSLTMRVEALETQRGIVPTASTYLAPAAVGASGALAPEASMGAGGGPFSGWFSRRAFNKLGRGFVNTITGWVEIPKRIHETSIQSGPLPGFTWGLLRGVGYGFVRTVTGVYEVVTFPVPVPPDYQPLMQPEYVFLGGA